MGLTFFKNTVLLIVLLFFSCGSQTTEKNRLVSDSFLEETKLENPLNLPQPEEKTKKKTKKAIVETGELRIVDQIIIGAEQFHLYASLLENKNVGVVANQTSFLENENQHLVDFLISKKVSIKKVFAP